MSTQDLLRQAQHETTTPFDYIVVGSGAGGGPLAARLASQGQRVLLIEAGTDAAAEDLKYHEPVPGATPNVPLRAIYSVPGYHAASTEDPEMSWEFSVRHYLNPDVQKRDSKYNRDKDTTGDGGIFYPRCSSIGGCTAHHAMIIARPNDGDWDRIADQTGDDSWRSDNMQGYFARIENCLYYETFDQFFQRKLGALYTAFRKILTFVNPKAVLDTQGHGFGGWQPTSQIDLSLVEVIAKADRTFRDLLFSIIWARLNDKGERSLLRRTLERWQVVQLLDPNARSAGLEQRARVALIPLATQNGRRSAVRERLLAVAQEKPDKLVILCEVLATRVVFRNSPATNGAPIAAGVEVAVGAKLYSASHAPGNLGHAPRQQYFAKKEVILSGGSFNTPQLLMLSGVGNRAALQNMNIPGPRAADDSVVADVVHLPGVGKNLQDRYEISVISEATSDFSTLNTLTFDPTSTTDDARIAWNKDGGGLYSTNGGAIAILASSDERQKGLEPDLFIFGFSAAFRGYYWNWSKQLLRRTKDAPTDQRNLWSWVILKAYTNNNGGSVQLRSASPVDPPIINFHSFSEGPDKSETDTKALLNGIRLVRKVNTQIAVLGEEIQPGATRPEGTRDLQDWLEAEAWGHHACGTCRLGSDAWVANTQWLDDDEAVLDSKFRVHGVQGLRVVDASIFPRIPGYFIVAPVMMIGEKAADTILADRTEYPQHFEGEEAAAIQLRRKAARLPPVGGDRIPSDAVGLALSGGGIRSATFVLGFLQALAQKGRLREIDYMSTVSGGGYIGCFLGRLYSRVADEVADKAGRIQDLLKDLRSPEIWWLRQNADYIAGEGRSESATDLAVVWRNLWSVHICLAALAFAVLGGLRAVSACVDLSTPLGIPPVIAGWTLSPWAWLLPAIFVLSLAPALIAYWFNPIIGLVPGSLRTAISWTVTAVGLTLILIQQISAPVIGILVAVILAWLWHEVACRGLRISRDDPATQLNQTSIASTLVGNRLTRALTAAQMVSVWAIAWVALDSLARTAAASILPMVPVSSGLLTLFLTVAPLLRKPAKSILALRNNKNIQESAQRAPLAVLTQKASLALLVSTLAIGWLFVIDLLVHVAFNRQPPVAITVMWVLAAISIAVGGAFTFVNRSSLQQIYAERLSRTFLGASSEARVRPDVGEVPVAVQNAHADDDISFANYHPERSGGPLHLVNVCVNQTVALTGDRQLSADKGLSMCVGPSGVSVGRRFHALWHTPKWGERMGSLDALPAGSDPNSFHVLARVDKQPAPVETLRLGQWMAISGAAYTTGQGRLTSLPISWFLGLINLRIGYWWNSGIDAGDRPSRYPPVLWRRLLALPGLLLRAQTTILDEWRARFLGPSERYWYLSDGGHFEGTGLYELIRRRLPLMIAVDSSQDGSYLFDDLAEIVRIARLDFSAEFHWMDPTAAREANAIGWNAFTQVAQSFGGIPPLVEQWANPDALGALESLTRDGKYVAALAAITYGKSPAPISWVLYVKAVMPMDCPQDVRTYAKEHEAFPNEPTVNQFFSDQQWECYRAIGEKIGQMAIR